MIRLMTPLMSVDDWSARILAGDIRAVSRAITAVENHDPAAQDLLDHLFPATGRAYIVGITGAPGTGKSTLVDRLAARYRAAGRTVGIVAVDPTSPYTGGAILGDRVRMQAHSTDDGIFIRSMATRGFLGGLARATADVALVLDAAGKQIVLIETVGVGQDEIDIVRLADCTVVLLVPGLGDDVQSMKAGLMEVADIFVINKAEREGTDRLEQQVAAMLQLAASSETGPSPQPPILRATATEGLGIAALFDALEQFRVRVDSSGERRCRALGHWKERLVELLQEQVAERAVAGNGKQLLDTLAAEVADRKKAPYAAVREMMDRAGLRNC
jgi:LAO/AO transport system kinase